MIQFLHLVWKHYFEWVRLSETELEKEEKKLQKQMIIIALVLVA